MAPADTGLAIRQPPRRRWRRLGLAVAVVGVLLLPAWFAYRAFGPTPGPPTPEDTWQMAVAQADRLDPAWRLEELQARRAAVPEDENSARVVLAAKEALPERWPRWRELDRRAGRPLTFEERLAFERSLADLPPPVQLDARQAAALKAELRDTEAALRLARRLADLPRGRFPPPAQPRPAFDFLNVDLSAPREVTRLLEFDAQARAQEGDLDGAVASCRAALNAGRSVGDEPGAVPQLVRLACAALALRQLERALAQGAPSPAALEAAQRLLEDEAAQPLLLTVARGERAALDRLLRAIQEGEVSAEQMGHAEDLADDVSALFPGVDLGRDRPAVPDKLIPWYHPTRIRACREKALRDMTLLVEVCKLPDHRQDGPLEQLRPALADHPSFLRNACLGSHRMARSCRRLRAETRCAAVGLAAERYRQATGRWPPSLAALVPRQMEAVPDDPFDGAPLRYRQYADGVVIYSVGPDLRDNGGTIDRTGPERDQTDLGFRLWAPELRRQAHP